MSGTKVDIQVPVVGSGSGSLTDILVPPVIPPALKQIMIVPSRGHLKGLVLLRCLLSETPILCSCSKEP